MDNGHMLDEELTSFVFRNVWTQRDRRTKKTETQEYSRETERQENHRETERHENRRETETEKGRQKPEYTGMFYKILEKDTRIYLKTGYPDKFKK